jgi:hypothetical protein
MGKQILIHGWQSTQNAIHRADLKKEQKKDSFFWFVSFPFNMSIYVKN